MTTPVRTRFAPSPTGYLHIGGVRTALFCWLFARRAGGQFILRIDDTDQVRNVAEALAPILHGLRWLGIDWDEGPEVGGPYAPYYQSQRQQRYREVVGELLLRGRAYRDFATPEEIQAERQQAEREKRTFRYSRRFAAETEADERRFAAQGRSGVVRLKMPETGALVIDDLVRGPVQFQWANEQDHVVQRADGSCLYHLASVVDDFDFRISHVIRAEEHLSNTPRQAFIAQALGFPLPCYAHLPYVAEPGSKHKLSKRKLDKYLKNRDFAVIQQHGEAIARALGLHVASETFNPVIVDFYEQVGYLPEALVNYLALLGWSLDDRTEFLSPAQLVEAFSLARVNRASASFDAKKLWAFQDHYMQALPLDDKLARVLPFLERVGAVGAPPAPGEVAKTRQIVVAAGDRIKVSGDILAYRTFFQPDAELAFDPAAFDARIRRPAGAREVLREVAALLAGHQPWTAAGLEALLHDWLESRAMKPAELVHALRVAVTGQAVGFGLFDTLEILGPDSTLARIERALTEAERPPLPNNPA